MSLETDIITALCLIYLVWLFAWAKSKLGSAKLAILFAVIVLYLVFILHPELIWVPIIIFIFATFGVALFSKIDVFKEK